MGIFDVMFAAPVAEIVVHTVYALVDLGFLGASRAMETAFRIAVLAAIAVGSVLALEPVCGTSPTS